MSKELNDLVLALRALDEFQEARARHRNVPVTERIPEAAPPGRLSDLTEEALAAARVFVAVYPPPEGSRPGRPTHINGRPLLMVGGTYTARHEIRLVDFSRLPTDDPGYLPPGTEFTVLDPAEPSLSYGHDGPDPQWRVRATVAGFDDEYLLSFAANEQAALVGLPPRDA